MTRSNYKTVGRQRLIQFLSQNPDKQFSVEELCRLLNGSPEKGRSSLYRQLDELCQTDTVTKFRSDERGCNVYQYTGNSCDCGNHFHEKCLRCGKLHHLDCDDAMLFAHHLLTFHGFAVDRGRSILYGVCAACRKKEGGAV